MAIHPFPTLTDDIQIYHEQQSDFWVKLVEKISKIWIFDSSL